MTKQLFELPNDEKTLYIIGNGFDLFHGLKTKFIHFCCWLHLQDDEHEKFVYDMEELFPKTNAHGIFLWTDFERALGEFDVCYAHDLCWRDEKDSNKYDPERAARKVHKIIVKIPVYLREWINNVDTSHLTRKIDISPKSLYLTFNYTLILEDIYKIPSNQILHIHKSLNDTESLITGHREYLPEGYGEISDANKEFSYRNLAIESNSLMKRVEEIIKDNHTFFDSLSQVNKVVIFGHSISEIDKPYFTEVFRQVQDDTKWYFVCYNENDRWSYERIVYQYDNSVKTKTGCDKYKEKMKPENCNYKFINEIKLK